MGTGVAMGRGEASGRERLEARRERGGCSSGSPSLSGASERGESLGEREPHGKGVASRRNRLMDGESASIGRVMRYPLPSRNDFASSTVMAVS